MAIFEEAADLQELARQLVARVDRIGHVECDNVLWLRETETQPKALARCYRIGEHPAAFFTDCEYAIVVYQSMVDYMTPEQMQLLLIHEMMHIPETGEKLIDHDVKDFRAVLSIGIDWAEEGAIVPSFLLDRIC